MLRRLIRRASRIAGRCRHLASRAARRAGEVMAPRLPRATVVNAGVDILAVPTGLDLGRSGRCSVRVTNRGPVPIGGGGPHAVRLTYHWLAPGGECFVFDGDRLRLPVITPGSAAVVSPAVLSPNTPADFSLRFELVQGRATWLGEHGSATAPCPVGAGTQAKIGDYRRVWQDADLEQDYWSVVGPGSRAEFERLGRIKRQMLVDLGLTPTSALLDVGCGTGLLTFGMEEYLQPEGLYYGTDIGPEAIAFCKAKYRRPNFHFLINEMTRIPIADVRFDQIVLFSVFTHLYPDEMTAMLIDLRRLLKPGGLILADVFLTRQVPGHTGTRAMVEMSPKRFEEAVAATGLDVSLHQEFPWSEQTKRPFYLFRHRAGQLAAAA